MTSISLSRTQDLFISQKTHSIELLNEKYNSLPSIKLSEYKKEQAKLFNKESICAKALFDYESICHEETPLVLSEFKELPEPIEHNDDADDDNIARSLFKTNQFNMQHFGIDLLFEVTLLNHSAFWIFNRVNADNEFDQFTSVMKLEVRNANNVYFSYGNFIYNKGQEDLIFKCFSKEQIALPLKERSSSLLASEVKADKQFYFKIKILDTCNEKIVTSIECEKKKYEFEGNWFLPVAESRHIVYGATGSYSKLNKILIKNYEVNNSKLVKRAAS